ncbi:MAG: MFS transporter [Cyanobacteria bacterium SZAS TMP-1]|nr:MFS transporter [Cyanobacteria bacterium SZAS TMP-1]
MPEMSALTIVCIAKAIRTFGFGAISVILALFLMEKGFSTAAVGAIFSATLIEDALATALVSAFAVRLGLRRVLFASCALVVFCGLVMGLCQTPWIVACAAIFGIISPAGYEGGPFSPVEQTLISESEPPARLTRAFSWYNLTGFGGAALGALFAGLATAGGGALSGSTAITSYQALFLLYAVGGALLALLYCMLDVPGHLLEREFASTVQQRLPAVNLHKSRGNVFKLAALQGIDAFGGGFVTQSLVVYWFLARYHAGPEVTGPLFFWANVLAAISFVLAPLVVRRIGLLKTMVFTHLPCSMALCLAPLMPDVQAATWLVLGRSLFSSMDIPVRQAYSMLLVCPDERPAAAGIISTARALSQGAAPLLSGLVLSGAGVVLGLPFICAGALKTVYDVGLFACFHNVPLEVLESDEEAEVDATESAAEIVSTRG